MGLVAGAASAQPYGYPDQNYGYQPPAQNHGGGGYGGTSDAAVGNLTVRMDQIQEQIQDLTGRVEELTHQLRIMSDRVERLESAPPPQPPPAPGGSYPGLTDRPYGAGPGYDDYDTGARQPYPPANPPPPAPGPGGGEPFGANGPGAPPSTLGTLPLSSGGQQLPPHAAPVAADSPEAQYDQAIGLLRAENYSAAQGAFKDFISKYPSDSLAGNAQYWLGETYYAQGQYRNAAEAFLQGFQKYPKSSKAPASLLKLGMSLGQLKQTKEACLTLNEIPKRYPNAPLMLRQRAEEERKSLSCS